jgi:beta-glucosidase
VLLKNENALLPLKKEKQRIAVIGPLANDCNSPLGSWRISSENFTAVSLLEGLVSFRGNEWIYQKGVELITEHTPWTLELKINDTDRTGIPEAIEAAREADIVIMAIGEHGFHTAEGRSRTKLDIPGLQQELLESVYEVNKNIVLVLFSGRPLTIPWAAEHIPAIVMAWQLGTESGQAIANVLMGDYNPSGKLPMTFPRSIGQVPIYYNHLNTGRPHHDPRGKDIVFWSHYIDERNDPLYPFGFGLSYSTFAYSYLRVKVIHTRQLNVLVDVENLSDMDGEEVIQLYIRDIVASVVRPVKELKGFDKQLIKAGEKKTITFSLGEEELGFFDQEGTFKFEPGVFQIMVGGSSDNTLKTEIQVN